MKGIASISRVGIEQGIYDRFLDVIVGWPFLIPPPRMIHEGDVFEGLPVELVIRLKGEKIDLEALARRHDLFAYVMTEEDGNYDLRITGYDFPINDDELLSHVRDLLNAINGLQKLDNLNSRSVGVDGVTKVDKDGHQTQYIFPNPVVARTRVGDAVLVGVHRINNESRRSTQKFPVDDPKIARALRWFDRGDWGCLYNILELVSADVGPKVYDHKWVEKGQIDLFKWTANNLEALGDDSRHAREDWDPPAEPMSLPDARKLMQALLKRWIGFKRSQD